MLVSVLRLVILVGTGLLLIGSECSAGEEERSALFLRDLASHHPSVHWTADSSHIVFGTDAAVYTYDLNVSRAVKVMGNTDPENDTWTEFEFAPAMSPDSERLVFVTYRHAPSYWKQIRGHRNRSLEIVTADLDGSNYERLTNDSWSDAWPVYSPDGQQIAFLSDREGNDMGVYVMNADGSDQRRVTPPHLAPVYMRPAWFPGGERLAFLAERDGPFRTGRKERSELFAINIDGSGLQSYGHSGALPAWSADGKRMAYATHVDTDGDPIPREGAMTLFTANADGSDPVRHGGQHLIRRGQREFSLTPPDIEFIDLDALHWGRDEHALLVVNGSIRWQETGHRGGINMYIVDLDTGAAEEEMHSSPIGSGFAISPDARFIGQLKGFLNASLFVWALDNEYKVSREPHQVYW